LTITARTGATGGSSFGHGLGVAENDANFTPRAQLGLPQTLASDECLVAVNRMEPSLCQSSLPLFRVIRPDDFNLDTRAGAFFEQADHGGIADLGIANKQLFPGAFDESGKLLSGVRGTHDKIRKTG
jgi:hypothetical protein